MLFLTSTTFGTFTLILYEESGEHFSFSFPPTLSSQLTCRSVLRVTTGLILSPSPTSMFDSLRRTQSSHTPSCETVCGYETVWPSERNQTWLICLFVQPQKPFHLPPPLSFSYCTCKYHWFLFSSFYFLLQSCLYLTSPHPADEAVLVCAFL